jgi:hypothetical protein
MINKKELLAIIWIFQALNAIDSNIFTLMDSFYLKQFLAGMVNGVKVTQKFMLFAAIIGEIPFLMIVFSIILPFKINKLTNIVAGVATIMLLTYTIIFGTPTLTYMFFSTIQLLSVLSIIIIAAKWNEKSIGEVISK